MGGVTKFLMVIYVAKYVEFMFAILVLKNAKRVSMFYFGWPIGDLVEGQVLESTKVLDQSVKNATIKEIEIHYSFF